MYDAEDEQRIPIAQLPLVLATVGKTVPAARIERLSQRKAAEGSDPFLTFEEFISLLGSDQTVLEAEEGAAAARADGLREALSLYDVGASGFILVAEARRALAEVMSESEFEAIIAGVGGEDGSGRVSVEALVRYIVRN